MKRILLVALWVVTIVSTLGAQTRPPRWNVMSAEQQRIWTANCQPPTAALASMCVVLGGPPVAAAPTAAIGAVAVCTDGQRFSLPAFEKGGLTPTEIGTINRNNAVECCRTHGRLNDNVLKILDSASVAGVIAAPAAVATIVPAPAPSTPTASKADTPAKVSPGCAENGSCYGETSDATGKPKTTYVSGYTRKDGTYVRGHYRSKE